MEDIVAIEEEDFKKVGREEQKMLEGQRKSHPRGLYVLFTTEMWERFSYYGMRAILTLYMTKALLFDKEFSSDIYGNYTSLVYLTPLLGGYIADKFWGNRRSILVGGLLMALGQFTLFFSASNYHASFATTFFYIGLALLIFGNGFFKPNISSMVGSLYPPKDNRIDSAFTIFYMGINIGAFGAPFVCSTLSETGNPGDFRWGFLAAGIGMAIGSLIFEMYKSKYIVTPEGLPVGDSPSKKNVNVKVETKQPAASYSPAMIGILGLLLVGSNVLTSLFFGFNFGNILSTSIFAMMIIMPVLILSDKTLTREEKQKIWVVFILAFFVIFFWSAFEQAGASLTFFADEQTNRNLFGWTVPVGYFQSINPVAIVVLAPIFAVMWDSLRKKNMEPSSPLKMAIGLGLLSLGYLVIALGVKGVGPSTKVSMMWLVLMYVIHTFGELCLSPIGLAIVNKLSPLKLASLMMGVWFLSNAASNKLAGVLSGFYPEQSGSVLYLDRANNVNAKASSRNLFIKDVLINKEATDTNVISVAVAGPTVDANIVNPTAKYVLLRSGINDVQWKDTVRKAIPASQTVLLDTVKSLDKPVKYKVVLVNQGKVLDSASARTNNYLSVVPTEEENDKALALQWNKSLDNNSSYTIYRKFGDKKSKWNKLASVQGNQYTDKDLKDDTKYSYLVVKSGTVSADNFDDQTLSSIKDRTNIAAAKLYPMFVGNEIDSLYKFFMIFVVMSATASLILLLVYRKLLGWMHGIS